MKASVIIPTYQRADSLIKAIDSVLKQDYKPIEIIVVDDNGKNSTFQKKTKMMLKNKYPKECSNATIKYVVLKSNSGGSIARNEGVKFATGKFLFFLDDDDVFLPKKVKTQIEILKSNAEKDGCIAAFKRIDESGVEIISSENEPRIGNFKDFVINGNFFTPMLCMKKESFIKSGGFVPIKRYQDRFYMLHCLEKGLQFAVINKPLHIMFEHSNNRISNQSIKKSINSLDMIKNYVLSKKQQFDFSDDDVRIFLARDNYQRGVIYYISNNYLNRLYSINFFTKSFFVQKNLNNIKMIFKAIIPFH